MKRIILFVALTVFSLGASGQSKLIYSHQDSDGSHSFGTSDIIVRSGLSDRHPMLVSLLASESEQGWSYYINIAVPELVSRAVPEGSILLVRAKSGEVLELANDLTEVQSRDFVGRWVEGMASKIYDNKASYPVTREQLVLLSSGVTKVRMQLSGEFFDTEYKKDKFGAAVKAHLSIIEDAIASCADIKSRF